MSGRGARETTNSAASNAPEGGRLRDLEAKNERPEEAAQIHVTRQSLRGMMGPQGMEPAQLDAVRC